MRKVIQILLGVAIIALAYFAIKQVTTPLDFQKVKSRREAQIIDKLKDIRSAEIAYKGVYQKYCGNFEELLRFVLEDSLAFKQSFGSKDDSVAVAKGLVKEDVFYKRVIDTVFVDKKLGINRHLTVAQVKDLPNVPHGNGTKFILNAGDFTTESGVVVPVFECKVAYKTYLSDQPEQELINLIDDAKRVDKYPGLKVGAMDAATNDAGNWE